MPVRPRLLKGPFTAEDYHRLAEAGMFGEDDPVEPLDGQIVEMTLIEPDHAACVDARSPGSCGDWSGTRRR